MKPEDVMQRVTEWQDNDAVHPLTCGNDSSHHPLRSLLLRRGKDAKVILVCDDCDYEQTYIPACVLSKPYKP